MSSGGRELVTVKKALEAQSRSCGPWKENILLYWLTDSTNLVTFLTKGSTKPAIQAIVVEVLILARSLNCTLQPIHLLRDDPRITIADAGSKAPDTDDWSVDQATFTWLSRELGPFTIDCFADESNKKVPRFFSNFLCPTSLGIDAFSHSWDYENCWICPPRQEHFVSHQETLESKRKRGLNCPQVDNCKFLAIFVSRRKKSFAHLSRSDGIQSRHLSKSESKICYLGKNYISFFGSLLFSLKILY